MHLTMKVVNLVDRLHLNELFDEGSNEVMLNLIKFNPKKLEAIIDKLIQTDGKTYDPNELEKRVLKELDF
jgi:hypothetical protein